MLHQSEDDLSLTPAATFAERHGVRVGMLAALASACAWLLYRNFGLNPAIFADEWYYSKMARLQPLADAMVPSYLYLWLFGGTRACGAAFLECARAANVVFFLAAVPFVYLVARAFTGKWPAMYVTLLSMLAPLNLFTAFFMPEAMYYFGFWLLSWIALTRVAWPASRLALATGAVLGLTSLVKVHALFLLPALCLFLLYACWRRGTPLDEGLGAMLWATAAAFAVKLGLGYLLAGEAALSLFGPFYQGAVNSAGGRSVLALAPPLLVSLRGHLMTLALLFGLPLALLAYGLLSALRVARLNLLYVYTLLMLGAALGVTVLFTASIASSGTNEGLRLHLRYYSFVFPLLWIGAAAALGKGVPAYHAVLRWGLAALLLGLMTAAVIGLRTYSLSPVDGIEIFALQVSQPAGRALAAEAALVLVLWAARSRRALPLYLYVVLPAMLVASLAAANVYLSLHVRERPADTAGRFAHQFVPAGEHHRIAVAGTDLSQLLRAQFHIDNSGSQVIELAPDAPLEPYQVPDGSKWLLVIGPHPLPDGITPLVTRPKFVLARVDGPGAGRARLSRPIDPGPIERIEGLSEPEHWGSWSNADKVVLRLHAPLPEHVDVTLKAQAYADNVRRPFTMHVGTNAVSFGLSHSPSLVKLHFDTDGQQRMITIDVPHPVAPRARGPGDERKIGIGIAEIVIARSVAPAPVLVRH